MVVAHIVENFHKAMVLWGAIGLSKWCIVDRMGALFSIEAVSEMGSEARNSPGKI